MCCKTIAFSILALLLVCRPAPAQFCPADNNGDLTVNIDDLVGVITGWGVCPVAAPCYADGNGDLLVNIDDLVGVITAWGSCNPVFDLELPAAGGGSDSSAKSGGGDAQGAGDDNLNIAYCTYRVDSSNPGSALVAGTIICTSCPLSNFNACPPLANCKFKGVPGNPTALSTGVNATRLGPGFCQTCPTTAGARKYYRTG